MNEIQYSKQAITHNFPLRSWDNIESITPDEWDQKMLKEIHEDPDCKEFVSQETALKELGLQHILIQGVRLLYAPDVNVHVLDFGNSIPATVTINDDGSFSIFLNARLSYEQRMRAYQHEMRHIRNEDFTNRKTIEEIECCNKH